MGELVPVSVDALATTELGGKVVQIVPAADPGSRSFLVKVVLPIANGLRSGLFGRAQFPRGKRSALLIPQTAVLELGQLQGVYERGEVLWPREGSLEVLEADRLRHTQRSEHEPQQGISDEKQKDSNAEPEHDAL